MDTWISFQDAILKHKIALCSRDILIDNYVKIHVNNKIFEQNLIKEIHYNNSAVLD